MKYGFRGADRGAWRWCWPDAALAQQPAVRVRGEIEKVDGNTLTVKARDGTPLTSGCRQCARDGHGEASLADIKPNSYIGVTADPQRRRDAEGDRDPHLPGGMRGTGEGHRPWDCGRARP